MRKKLTMAIMSLVIAASLLTTATFAWFNMSTEVTVGSMDMTVQTVGSLYIRTHDYATTINGNTRAFRTSIDIPTDSVNREGAAGIQPTVSLYRFAQWLVTSTENGGAGENASVLNLADGETQEQAYIRALTEYFTAAEGTFSMTTNPDNVRYELKYFTNPQEYPELYQNELFFDVKERMMRAENPRSSTKFVIAGDNMDYGKWNFDLLSAAQDQNVTIEASLGITAIKRYNASISVTDVLRDYLAAYTIEIYEFQQDVNDPVFNDTPIAVGKIPTASINTIIGDVPAGPDQQQIDYIKGTNFNVPIKFTFNHEEVVGENVNVLGKFTADVVRSFEIYTYIDGTTTNITTDNLNNVIPNQNHLTNVGSSLGLKFNALQIEPATP